MAGSRLEKFGTVYSRVRDLMRAGVIKRRQKPVWFDVYAAFPPRRSPVYVPPQTRPRRDAEQRVPDIFYKEDLIRAKFYQAYGSGPKAFDLSRANFVSTCQRFVEKYSELEARGEFEEDALFNEAGKALLAEGVVLKRKSGSSPGAAELRDPVLDMKLTDMLAAEKHGDSSGGTPAARESDHWLPV
ncbi:small ribosomal subunit protein mS23 [Denticeps clupeoides]|uniref:small ribosomal subunit protein mS23 n=1 Tax=Denticeps clupeoides TaxID=299321 RepID=UPI0010A3D425|nr:28S ribosomal protein S23, mitochondrial [Denticeps clupeoides]